MKKKREKEEEEAAYEEEEEHYVHLCCVRTSRTNEPAELAHTHTNSIATHTNAEAYPIEANSSA